ncbi:hypothetical protein [Xanthomonas hortorum]|uniref:Uncharacterized protein n=1 Tax=Xanthomonas hortorum pv. hederae TaxID=453603 RepID=A0A9X4H7Y4_9XANT|nr:hypothetical protein [Xanthomonas hortorum]MCE4373589.1 hypothetical protein [Xanthomonas hortorum pv. hederae]MDC8640644.1 hypothetical protein [Xanthomonas hortorum pv. hederae]PPU73238.1 hypothetical protein XhhCFBP4925_22210 [Xanthomonas hortorum pv. hederae]
MEVAFEDPLLKKLELDPSFTAGFDAAIVKAFRKRLQLIRAAVVESHRTLSVPISFEFFVVQ